MDDGRRTPSDGKSSHCLWQGELKKKAVKNYDSAAMVNQILKHNINKFNMCTSQ